MTQEQLNTLIAEEMNKWQPIYEYATLFIDRANERNKKFKWIIWLYKERYAELIIALMGGIITYFHQSDTKNSIYALVVLLALLFIVGKLWPNLVEDSDIKELSSMQKQTSLYLNNLSRWLPRLDLHEKTTSKEVAFIEQEYIAAQVAQMSLFDRYSSIHGTLDAKLNVRAKERAEENLKPFQKYISNE